VQTKVMQFGEGNFMRAFIDWMIQRMNATAGFGAAVQVVQPRGTKPGGAAEALNAQGGKYTVVLRGLVDGNAVETFERIDCVRGCLSPARDWAAVVKAACEPSLRFFFSNTTEAGIEYKEGADTFPSKVARLLTARCECGLPGLVFLPCELIERNGAVLKECVLKYLDSKRVKEYVQKECVFCDTLVDRIVAGAPEPADAARFTQKLGFEDKALVCAEPFHFFAIQGPEGLAAELPFEKAGLNVVFTDDVTPYRTRKVRFLNGAHTSTALAAHLAGLTFVEEMVRDPTFGAYLRKILFEEIFPTVKLPDADKKAYAESVLERFANPYAKHRLLSIALNSVSKWKVRVLPTILDYLTMYGRLPQGLTQSMASLIRFYRACDFQDTPEVKAFFAAKPGVPEILGRIDFWGQNLNELPGFRTAIEASLAKPEPRTGPDRHK
jgi:tagaturonate reductase